jgi:endonuclease III
LLVSESIEVEDDLYCWLQTPNHVDLLLSVKGVGPKTADYLKGLVGLPAVAVDRHLRAFVALAGVSATGYEEIRSLICATASVLGHDPSSLDYAIWSYMSQSQARAERRMVA